MKKIYIYIVIISIVICGFLIVNPNFNLICRKYDTGGWGGSCKNEAPFFCVTKYHSCDGCQDSTRCSFIFTNIINNISKYKKSLLLINHKGNGVKLEFDSHEISRIYLNIRKGTNTEMILISKDYYDLIFNYIENGKKTEVDLFSMMMSLYIILNDDSYIKLDFDSPNFTYTDTSKYQHKLHVLFKSEELSNLLNEIITKNNLLSNEE